MTYTLRVLFDNRGTMNASATTVQIYEMQRGFESGKYSMLEIRMVKTEQLLYNIPKKFYRLIKITPEFKNGHQYYLVRAGLALEALKKDKCS